MDATHLVAGGSGVPLKRTPKLLAGIGQCRFVVDVEWLYQSAAKGLVLDGLQYVLYDSEVCGRLRTVLHRFLQMNSAAPLVAMKWRTDAFGRVLCWVGFNCRRFWG